MSNVIPFPARPGLDLNPEPEADEVAALLARQDALIGELFIVGRRLDELGFGEDE